MWFLSTDDTAALTARPIRGTLTTTLHENSSDYQLQLLVKKISHIACEQSNRWFPALVSIFDHYRPLGSL